MLGLIVRSCRCIAKLCESPDPGAPLVMYVYEMALKDNNESICPIFKEDLQLGEMMRQLRTGMFDIRSVEHVSIHG